MGVYRENTMNQIDKVACTGCGACENICPTGAITMTSDREGFWYPDIDEKNCIHCNKCAAVCPIFDKSKLQDKSWNKKQPKVYAAWSLNPEIRYHSTSGGIFSELALEALSKGGYICGAVYDEQKMVKHFITNNEEDITRLRQSKYVQSDMGKIYKEIGSLLKNEKNILFCGSPCQCAGVFHYCKQSKIDMTNLYLIDFICRGSNSPKVYRKFLDELEKKYESNVKKVWFKNKTYGWNRFSTKIEFEDGEFYLQDRHHDAYIRGYIEENLFIRPSCEQCGFKGLQRFSDLTLADFWGVQLKDGSRDSDGGTSMVMVHTEKGERLWNALKGAVYIEEKNLEEAALGNDCFYNSIQAGIKREQFMKDLDAMPVINNIERFLK